MAYILKKTQSPDDMMTGSGGSYDVYVKVGVVYNYDGPWHWQCNFGPHNSPRHTCDTRKEALRQLEEQLWTVQREGA